MRRKIYLQIVLGDAGEGCLRQLIDGCLKLAPILQQQTKAEISGGTWKLPDKTPLETADIN